MNDTKNVLFQRLKDKPGYRERWKIAAKTTSHNRDGAQAVTGRITDDGRVEMINCGGNYVELTGARAAKMTSVRRQFAMFLLGRIEPAQ